jgi:O-antigen ligase
MNQKASASTFPGRWRRQEAVVTTAAVPTARVASRASASADATAMPFFFLCVLTFILFGRPQDYFAFLVPLRLALMFTLLTTLVTLGASSSIMSPFAHRETKLYLGLYLAMVVGIAFAAYRPGTFDAVIMKYIVNVAYFLLFVAIVDSLARLRRIAVLLVLSVLLFTGFNLAFGQFAAGRFFSGISMFDPNDIALVEVSLLSYSLWVLAGSFNFVTKGLALASILLGMLLTLYTGSRGGLLGLLTFLLLFLFVRVPGFGKPVKTIMVVAVIVLAAANASKINIERYLTLTSLEGDYNFEEMGREDIWKRGLRLFLQHPLTGVGVNSFSPAIGTQRAADGVIPRWQEAHNAYVQILAETGIFGATTFFLLVVGCIKTYTRLRRSRNSFTEPDFAALPGVLLIGFIAQLVTATFLSQGYSMFFTMSFAMSAVLNRIAPTLTKEGTAARTGAVADIIPRSVTRGPVASVR